MRGYWPELRAIPNAYDDRYVFNVLISICILTICYGG